MGKMCRAVVYCRVSTEEQAENGTSLETQERAGGEFVRRELAGEVAAVRRDEGISGALYDRPGLQAALAMVEGGQADVLVAYDITRLSRDAEHQQRIKKRVRAAGGRLAFCKGHFEDTEEGDLAFGIMGNFAAYERGVFRRRSMSGKRERAMQGVQPCRTHSPYGYHVVNSGDVMDGRHPKELLGTYLVVEEQARWVRDIFAQYAAHGCLSRIVRSLREQGAPTSRGGRWLPATVRAILSNPVYKGTAAYGRRRSVTQEGRRSVVDATRKVRDTFSKLAPESEWTLIDAPALVDAATWDACQERLRTGQAEKQAVIGGNPGRKFMLAGLVRCPVCGWRLSGHRNNQSVAKPQGATYYVCRNMDCGRSKRNSYACNRAERLESLTSRAMLRLAEEPCVVPDAIRAYRDHRRQAQAQGEADGLRARLTAELSELVAREASAVEAQLDALHKGRSADPYERALDELDARKRAVSARLAELAPPEAAPNAGRVPAEETAPPLAKVLEALRKVLAAPDGDLSPAEKQAVLAVAIERILPTEEGIEVELRKHMGTLYKVTVTFQGMATLEIEADTPEAARLAAKELTVADLARAGRADIVSFAAGAREIVPIGDHPDAEDEETPRKPRPSGWYRPL